MIQDIAPHQMNNQYKNIAPSSNSIILCFNNRTMLLDQAGIKPRYMNYEEYRKLGYDQCIYLFSIDDQEYFLGDTICSSDLPQEYEYMPMIETRQKLSREDCFVGSTAYHLYVWYKANRFCGGCGKPLTIGTKERVLICPKCGNMVYPKVAPAVIVGVTKGDSILMTKYAGREYTKYALLAGFCEIGETAEETVKREVMEEVGLKVKNIRYYKSQPWGFDSNLLLGFFAELDGEDNISLDQEELALASWVKREDAKGLDDGLSLTREMMGVFARGEE